MSAVPQPTLEVRNSRVAIALSVEIDLAAWAYEYGCLTTTEAREDVRAAVANLVEHHLRATLGFTGAAVDVRNTSYRPARMRQ